jgi:hypothetical protein
MRTNVRETSLKAYDAIRADGTAATQAGRILAFIRANPGSSRADVERGTGIKINAVCGRVKQLLEDDAIVERGEKFDPATNRNVMRLEAVPAQCTLGLDAP